MADTMKLSAKTRAWLVERRYSNPESEWSRSLNSINTNNFSTVEERNINVSEGYKFNKFKIIEKKHYTWSKKRKSHICGRARV